MGRIFGSELCWQILSTIADGFEVIENSCLRPGATMRYGLGGLKSIEAERKRAKEKAMLYRLRKQGLIEKRLVNDQQAFQLTILGEKILERHKMSAAVAMLPGKLTIVSFDIPERHRDSRRRFRLYLRGLGFTRRHLSVWVSDRDWSESLMKKMAELKIKDWIVIMKGEIVSAQE